MTLSPDILRVYRMLKLPNCGEAVGELCLDIKVYLEALEAVYTAGFGEGVQVLFCVFNGHCEASKELVIT